MRLSFLVIVPLTVIMALFVWRVLDHRADDQEMARLLALQPPSPETFTLSMIADLPEPAQRYFRFVIAEGTPLLTVARLKMSGRFSLGSKGDPDYMSMTATQVLGSPEGFVWKLSAKSGHLSLSGSDSAKWTRFWMGGLMPVARFGDNGDHARSAFGRYAAEAVFWTPAAVLPGPGIAWEAVDVNTARVTISSGDLSQAIDLSVADDGRPTKVTFQRWSNANAEGVFRSQPFGGFLSNFEDVQGFRLPTHVEAGNFFGTDDYFPFFIADVTEIEFPTMP